MDGCICNRAEQKDGRDVCACAYEWDYVRTGERWEMEGVGHINKDLANIMIMFEHSPELVLAGSSSPK